MYFVVGLYFFILGGSHFYGIFIQTTLIGAVEKYSTFMTPSNNLLLHLYSSVFCSCQTIKWKRRNLATTTNDYFSILQYHETNALLLEKYFFVGYREKKNMDLENQKTVGCTQNHGQKIEIRMRFLVFSSSNHNDSSQIRTFASF